MAVEYWLISGNSKLRLPVNPQVNSYNSPYGYDDFEVEGLGEVTTIKRRGLRDFAIQSFWPRDYNPTYCEYSDFISPSLFVRTVEDWRNQRKPVRYVVTGAVGINLAVTIRDFQIDSERAGSPGDVYYTLALKEWREQEIKTVTTTSTTTASTKKKRTAKAKSTPAKTYVVKSGDSLYVIAKKPSIYGDGTKWRKIYDANKKAIGKNPNNLDVGMKLVIPK